VPNNNRLNRHASPDKALQASRHQSYTALRHTELQLLKQFN